MRLRTVPVRIAAVLAAAALSATAAHAGAWLPAPGEYYSRFTADRSVSDTYYDADGARFVRPFGGFEEVRELHFHNEFGWKKWASLQLAVPFRSRTQSVGEEFGYASRTSTGLADLDVGLKIRLKDGISALALQFDWNAPLGYEHDVRDTVLATPGERRIDSTNLGTGRQTVQGSLLYGQGFPAWNVFVEAEGGYRTETSSDGIAEVFANAGAGVWVGESILLSGRWSLVSTTESIQSLRTRAIAGFYGADLGDLEDRSSQLVNPQFLYRVDDRLDVFFGSVHSMSGESVLHRDVVYVGMAFKNTRLNRYQGFLGGKRKS
jgi:hypothetical protein